MTTILVAGGIGLFLGFSLGVFFMALVKVSEPVPAPEVRHVDPVRQEQDAALAAREHDDARQWLTHRSPGSPRTSGNAPRDPVRHSASHTPVTLGTGASLTHPRTSISATASTAP